MKLLMMTAALVLSGCANLTEVKEERETLFAGEIKGDYSALAHCVAAKMQTDERKDISTLQYSVRVYPDIGKSEVLGAYVNNKYHGAAYAFHLELKKAAPNVSDALLKGGKYEGVEALKTLHACSTA